VFQINLLRDQKSVSILKRCGNKVTHTVCLKVVHSIVETNLNQIAEDKEP